MTDHPRRGALLFSSALTAITLFGFGVAANAADQTYQFDIPAESLGQALTDFSRASSQQIVFSEGEINGKSTVGIHGRYTVRQALGTLLAGTTLMVEPNSSGVLTVRPKNNQDASDAGANRENQDAAPPAPSAQSAAEGEVIVTAQKRAQRLIDVPVPVTEVQSETLVSTNKVRLQDYYSDIPNFVDTPTPSAGGQQNLTVRGITTGFGNPTVGVTIDDVPYGAFNQAVTPDIDPGELASVEVLRGPQGTLYGASSMGGLLKYVTLDPSVSRFSGQIEGGVSSVSNGAEIGYSIRGSVNIPVSDTFAINGGAFTRQDPGYINNPILDEKGVNEAHANGGRVAALWRPNDDFSIKLSALYQDLKGDGANDVDVVPGLRGLEQNYIPHVGGYDRTIEALSGVIKANLGWARLTSITGFSNNRAVDSLDYTYGLSGITENGYPPLGIPGYGVTGTPLDTDFTSEKFTQEVRLAIPIGSKIDWLIGGFYDHELNREFQHIAAENAVTGEVVGGNQITFNIPELYQEYAIFTDVTYHFTDKFDIQVGLRDSELSLSSSEVDSGPLTLLFYGVPSPNVVPKTGGSDNAFTYLFAPEYKLSKNVMVYARIASGYRPGNVNVIPDVPHVVAPDTTENYEVGLKGEFFDRILTIDTSFYYIDWNHIQVGLLNPQGLAYSGNGGSAESEGLEFSAQLRPWHGFTLSPSFAIGDAQLTSDLPPATAYGPSGTRLPYSSRFSGTIEADQSFPITDDLTGDIGGSVNYIGDRFGPFAAKLGAPRQEYPGYTKLNLYASLLYQDWKLSVYANNVTDVRGLLGGGVGTFPPYAFTLEEPRTVGVSVARKF